MVVLPALLGASVAAHEGVHCALAYAGGATSCTIDLLPGWCADPDMTLSGFCLGSATAHRSHAPLPIVVEELVAYIGGAVPVLVYALLRSHRSGPEQAAGRAELQGTSDPCSCMRVGVARGRRACAAMGRCGVAPGASPERQ